MGQSTLSRANYQTVYRVISTVGAVGQSFNKSMFYIHRGFTPAVALLYTAMPSKLFPPIPLRLPGLLSIFSFGKYVKNYSFINKIQGAEQSEPLNFFQV